MAGTAASPAAPGVLVVDDESEVIRAISAALGAEGFPVWSALTGAEAVRLYQQHKTDIGVVLLDVQMPVLDGPATLNQLRAVQPDLVCYFMAADLGGYDEVTLRQRGAIGVLRKPLHLDQLCRALRNPPALAAAAEASAPAGSLRTIESE